MHGSIRTGILSHQGRPDKPGISYGQNNWLFNLSAGVTNIQNRPSEWHWRNMNVKGANNVPVFADTMWRGGGPFTVGQQGDPPQFTGQWLGAGHEMQHFCIDRHNDANNHLFLDWTVHSVDIKESWTLKWHKRFDVSGPWTRSGGVQPADWPAWMRGFKDH